MLKKYGKYPILKISKISDVFELENIGYISPMPTVMVLCHWLIELSPAWNCRNPQI